MVSSRFVTVGACVLAGFLAFAGAPAGARVIHKFESVITEIPAEGPGPQKQLVPLPGKLGPIGAMAFDSGGLYVAEPGRVDQFSASTNAFVSQLVSKGSLGGLGLGMGFGHTTGQALMYLGVQSPTPGVGVFAEGACGALECFQLQGEEWTGSHTPNESFVSEKGEGSGVLANVAVDDSTAAGDWASGDVFVSTQSSDTGQFPNLNVVDVFNPVEAAQAGDEPPSVVTQLHGTPVGETIGSTEEGEPFEKVESVAVSGFNGDVYVADGRQSGEVVNVFQPVGAGEYAFVGRLAPPGGFAGRVSVKAIDGSTDGSADDGDVYVVAKAPVAGNGTRSVVYEFGASGVFLGALKVREELSKGAEEAPANELQNVESLAVDPVLHRLYVGDFRDQEPGERLGVVEVFGADATLAEVATEAPGPPELEKGAHAWRTELKGSVNPENGGDATCSFVWGTSPALGHVTPCSGTGEGSKDPVLNGAAPVPVHAVISGLEPGTTYYYRLRATNANGTNTGEEAQNVSFFTPGPGFHSESTSDLSSTSVTFSASINPDSRATSYHFEYDTSAYSVDGGSHGVSMPAADLPIGSGSADVGVSRHAQGLSPRTTYHYRVVAVSELEPGVFEEFEGPDQVFSTQGEGGSFSLVDGRDWELVSPADKHGALIFGLVKSFTAPVQASLDGGAVTYAAFTPTESAAAGFSVVEQVVSRREGSGGGRWSSRDISPPHGAPTGIGTEAEYQVFSKDLSVGVLEPFHHDPLPLSSLASESTPYELLVSCEPSASEECYTPLVSGKEGELDDVPAGTVFGGRVRAVGASSDARHVVLRSSVQLTGTPTEGHTELYEWSADESGRERLQLVSFLPVDEGGAPVACIDACVDLGNDPGEENISSGEDPISVDGSRVFWTVGGGLYLRDTGRGETVRLDVAQSGVSGGEGQPVFETASVDGSRVFFTDEKRLTAQAGRRGADLYECAIVVSGEKDACSLRDLTPEGASGPSEVRNLVLGASEDSSFVYFVANGILGTQVPAGVQRGGCRVSGEVVSTCNLYVSHNGDIRFIATLSSEDQFDWGTEKSEHHRVGNLTARVSGNGNFATFMSVRPLTGYDNLDVHSGTRDAEVFEYDAAAATLACVSCSPFGSRPTGRHGVAARIPEGVALGEFQEALYLPRVLSDGGRLFFDSSDGLVSLDTNGQQDVYEFEPVGVGDCSARASTFSGVTGGCTSLISSGTSSEESQFLDASGTGNDVFFLTGETLVGEDRDTAFDVYDARVCSVSEPCTGSSVAPPACVTADACRSAPQAPSGVFASPASATFSGAGNPLSRSVGRRALTRAQKRALALRACHKKDPHSHRRRASCERQVRRRYPASGKRVAKRTRRAGR